MPRITVSAAGETTTVDYTDPGLLVGANEGMFDALETQLGKPLDIRRSYASNWYTSLNKVAQDRNAGRQSWVSFVIWPTATDLSTLIAAIDSPTILTYLHEVNNGPRLDAATFRARVSALCDAAASNPLVRVAVILTADAYRAGTHGQWFPAGKSVIVGVDAYRFLRESGSLPDPKTGNLGTPRTLEWLCGQAPAFAASIGAPLAIGEFGAHPFNTDHANRPTWLQQSFSWLRYIGAYAACYFHSPLGESGPWLADRFHAYTTDENDPARLTGAADPDTLAAFRAQL